MKIFNRADDFFKSVKVGDVFVSEKKVNIESGVFTEAEWLDGYHKDTVTRKEGNYLYFTTTDGNREYRMYFTMFFDCPREEFLFAIL